MRKEAYVEGNVDEGRLRPDLAAIHVDHVADSVKCVEADADREDDPHHRHGGGDAEIGERGDNIRQKEIIVLEQSKYGQVEADARCKQSLTPTACCACEQLACGKCIRRDEQHQKAETPVPDGVEQVACDRQQPLQHAGVATTPVQHVDDGQKRRELERDEVHGQTLISTRRSPSHLVKSSRPAPCRWSKSYQAAPCRKPARSWGSSPTMQANLLTAQKRRA